MENEKKFTITLIDDLTGETVERTDYDFTLECMQQHYDSTGLNVVSIKQR